MKFLTVFFTIACVGSIIALIFFKVYADGNPLFAALIKPFIYISVATGGIIIVCIAVLIARELRK